MLVLRFYWGGLIHLFMFSQRDISRKFPSGVLCTDGNLWVSEHGRRMGNDRMEFPNTSLAHWNWCFGDDLELSVSKEIFKGQNAT